MVNNQGMGFLCLTWSRSQNFIFAPAPVLAKSFEFLQLLFRLHNAATQLLISRQPLKISNLVADMIRLCSLVRQICTSTGMYLDPKSLGDCMSVQKPDGITPPLFFCLVVCDV